MTASSMVNRKTTEMATKFPKMTLGVSYEMEVPENADLNNN